MENKTLTLEIIGRDFIIKSHDHRSNIATIRQMIEAAALMTQEIIKITPLAEFEAFIAGYETLHATLKDKKNLANLITASQRIEREHSRAIKISSDMRLVTVLSNPVTTGLELLKHIEQTPDREVGRLSDQIIELGSTIAIGREIIDKYAGDRSAALETKICEKIARLI